MRITYRTLGQLIARMNDDQLDSDVTVEDDTTNAFPAELRIAADDHDSLDPGHPILYVLFDENEQGARRDDIEGIAKDIGL